MVLKLFYAQESPVVVVVVGNHVKNTVSQPQLFKQALLLLTLPPTFHSDIMVRLLKSKPPLKP